MRKRNQPGCPCCSGGSGGGCGQVCVTVFDCNSEPDVGATVKLISGGTTRSTATTDTFGKACVSIPSAGTYTLQVTPATARMDTYSAAAYRGCATYSQTVFLTPSSGYYCWCSMPSTPAPPAKSVLNLTDSRLGISTTLTNTGSGWFSPSIPFAYPGWSYAYGGTTYTCPTSSPHVDYEYCSATAEVVVSYTDNGSAGCPLNFGTPGTFQRKSIISSGAIVTRASPPSFNLTYVALVEPVGPPFLGHPLLYSAHPGDTTTITITE